MRLDKDGKQRLYTYSLNNGESKELIADLVVAYYTWHDENLIVSAVIEENGLNLFVKSFGKPSFGAGCLCVSMAKILTSKPFAYIISAKLIMAKQPPSFAG